MLQVELQIIPWWIIEISSFLSRYSISFTMILLLFLYSFDWFHNSVKYTTDITILNWFQITLFQILVSKWNMNSILILIEYSLQQSPILSILDLHQISKSIIDIYSFIHICTNTSDWLGSDTLEWIRKMNSFQIRNIYSSFNYSISN